MGVMDQFSVTTYPWGKRPPTIEEIVKATQHAEKLGFYSINIPLLMGFPDVGSFKDYNNKYVLDALVVLPEMVRATTNLRIAIDSMPLPVLPPFEWAKYIATLDVMSGGRVIAGMCLGFGEENFGAVGVNSKYRGKMSDEQVEIITRLWTEDEVTYEGRFYQLKNVRCEPKPAQKPYPPIWWGGRQQSIPRAARYCEYLNTLWPTLDEVKNDYIPRLEAENKKWGANTKLATWLYCVIDDKGPMSDDDINSYFGDFMTMEIKGITPKDITMSGSPEQCAAKIKAYREAGISLFVLDFQRHGLDPFETWLEQTNLFVEKVVPLL